MKKYQLRIADREIKPDEIIEQNYNKFIKERLPRKKMGNVNEILPMLLFLCSKYSSMMGGCMVPIDAGEGKNYLI